MRLLCLILILLPLKGFCYEENVHEKITTSAIDTSVIGQYLNKNLNISLNDSFNSGNTTYNAKQWIEQGSKLEDASPRWVNHFYDPTTGLGLNGDTGSNGLPSLQWGKDSLLNEYNWKWARQSYYNALTASDPTFRERFFSYVFRSLGQVMHLVQDLASPAHVRNDPHFPYIDFLIQQQDMYEKFTKDAANGTNGVHLIYAGYPAVDLTTFNTLDSFWKSGGKGLAEFTNRNFLSRDTNFEDLMYQNYNMPIATGESIVTEQVSDWLLGPLWVNVKYLKGYVTDYYRGELSKPIDRLSAFSYFDYEMKKYNFFKRVYSLNDKIHKEYSDLLLPRAVGYSSGLLNYFFRGRMDIVKDQNTSGSYIIKNGSDETMDGVFSLYYDDVNDKRYLVNSWNLSGSNAIPPHGQSNPVSFAKPTSPLPKEKGKYTLVFQGKLGNEIGAVVGKVVSGLCDGTWVEVVNQSCKSTFTYNPNSYPCSTILCWNGCFTTGLLYYEQIAGGIKENWSYYKTCYSGSCSGCTFTISPSTCPPVPVSDPGCGSYSSGVGGIVEDFNTINYTKYEWRCP